MFVKSIVDKQSKKKSIIYHMDNMIEEYIHLDIINNEILFNNDNVKRCVKELKNSNKPKQRQSTSNIERHDDKSLSRTFTRNDIDDSSNSFLLPDGTMKSIPSQF